MIERGNIAFKVLGDPSKYPDEFKSWLPRYLAGLATFQVQAFQLPPLEALNDVGDTAHGKPAFLNSWTNYGTGYETAEYYKDGNGRVSLSGIIKSGSVGSAAFTLPGGYRPRAREAFAVLTNTGIGQLDVLSTGDVIPATGGNGYVSLSGITFRQYS